MRERANTVVAVVVACIAMFAATRPAPAATCTAASYTTRTLDGATAPPLPPPKRLLRFVQLSDVHLYDDDASPLITGSFVETALEPAIGNGGAQRLQDEYTDEVLNAVERTINACHALNPIAFAIATGDSTDNMLLNETRRFIDNLDGVAAGDTAFEAHCGYTTHDSRGVPKLGAGPCTPELQAGFALFTGKLVADSQSTPPDPDSPIDQLTATRSAEQIAASLAAATLNGSLTIAPGLPGSLRCNSSESSCANARLGVPYFAVFGNHEGGVRGTLPMQQALQPFAASYGRYWFESQREWINEFFFTTPAPGPVGHGFDRVEPERFTDPDDRNDGYYAFDAGADGGVRMIVLNTLYDGVRSEFAGDGQTNEETGGLVTGNEVTNPIGLEQGVLSLMETQFAQLLRARAVVGRINSVAGDRQTQGCRDRGKLRRLEAEERASDLIGHLIVFGPTDAVKEQIAEHDSREQRRRESARADFHAARCQMQQLIGGGRGVAIAGQREAERARIAVGDHQLVARLLREQRAATRDVGRPNPEWRFEPTVRFREIGHGVSAISQVMRMSIRGQGIVVRRPESRQMREHVSDEPGELGQLADDALW